MVGVCGTGWTTSVASAVLILPMAFSTLIVTSTVASVLSAFARALKCTLVVVSPVTFARFASGVIVHWYVIVDFWVFVVPWNEPAVTFAPDTMGVPAPVARSIVGATGSGNTSSV